MHRRRNLILNLAIGGKLAETRGVGGVSDKDFPKQLTIDWVRVWQKAPDPATACAGQAERVPANRGVK